MLHFIVARSKVMHFFYLKSLVFLNKYKLMEISYKSQLTMTKLLNISLDVYVCKSVADEPVCGQLLMSNGLHPSPVSSHKSIKNDCYFSS